MAKYDVVVVGAGNSGMSAALQCQLAGKKTLLIEKHNLPGGAATSFVRGRFEFEPSLHELCDFGPASNPGDVRNLFEAYGVKLNWIECPDCFRVITEGHDGKLLDATMPAGIENFIAAMEGYVPGSKAKMTEFFELCDEILRGLAYITASNGNPDSKVLQSDYPNLLRTGAYPTRKVLNAMKLPKECQDIIETYWSYLGVDLEHLAFVHYAAMVHKYVSRGAYIPAHTSHEMSTAMIERFRELGGEVWFNCRAEEFLFDGDKLCGVRTNMGVIDCKYVLANINPDIIYGKMMPKELIPEREKKLSAARGRTNGGKMFTAYLGLDKSPEELGIKDYSIFLSRYADSTKEYKCMQSGIEENDYSIFLCYNIANPEFSPKGTSVVSFTTFGANADWDDIKQEDYHALKEKYLRKFIKSLKGKAGIDLEGHIEELEIASPWTFARYLGVPDGAVYGYEARDWDGMMPRLQMLASDYPIKGLRPIGAAGPRSDGYSATFLTGQLMARLAIKDLAEEGGKN